MAIRGLFDAASDLMSLYSINPLTALDVPDQGECDSRSCVILVDVEIGMYLLVAHVLRLWLGEMMRSRKI